MSLSENILLFVSAFGFLQAILLAAILYFHPQSDRSVTTFLGLYITCLCIPMLASILQHYVWWQAMIFTDPFPILLGPLLYFYVRSFREKITFKKAWPHLILFVFYFVVAFTLYDYMTGRYPKSNVVPPEVLHMKESIIRIVGRIIIMTLYFFLSHRAWRRHQKSIQQVFSETSRINLEWVKLLINGYLFIVSVMVVNYIIVLNFPEQFSIFMLVNTSVATPYVYLAAYKGITQPSLWQLQPLVKQEVLEEEMLQVDEMEDVKGKEDQPRHAKSTLSKEKIDEIVLKTIAAVEQEKLYQQTELTLQELADKIQIPSYQLSLAINEGLQKNFYDLINNYRVEEAKRLLLDPGNKNYKVLSVGFDAGFASKTTFNTVFKKFTGLTPTDFRERNSLQV